MSAGIASGHVDDRPCVLKQMVLNVLSHQASELSVSRRDRIANEIVRQFEGGKPISRGRKARSHAHSKEDHVDA